ncbi:UNVERIFIED_CONTAM: hypothetical protein Sradi_1748100 [Sesamum radiatum]|uniref:DUF4283 domain-containing protein n=1 Tax=Sesamum radiatum TaxID=300843 RepID=A0AAW2TUB8_SESRA
MDPQSPIVSIESNRLLLLLFLCGFLVSVRGLWGAGSILFIAKVCWSFLDIFPTVYSSQKAFPAHRKSSFSARSGLLAAHSFAIGSWLFQTAAGSFSVLVTANLLNQAVTVGIPPTCPHQPPWPSQRKQNSLLKLLPQKPANLRQLPANWLLRLLPLSHPGSHFLHLVPAKVQLLPSHLMHPFQATEQQTASRLPPTANISGKGTTISSDKTKVHSLVFHEFINGLEASPRAGMVPTSNSSGSRLEEVLPAKTGQTDATGTTKTSYAGLFSTNRRLMDEKKLRKIEDKDETLKLDTNDLIDVRSKLGHCLVGYIADKFLGLKAIGALSKSWEATFQLHASGWLVFKFATEEDMQRIVTGGPYFIFDRPLMLKSMPVCFGFQEDDISLTPVWATLPSLPLECWNPNALSKIGSRLGNPVAMDSLTMNMERISYARILVEVDASKELVDQVEFILPDGTARKQPVRYEFMPKFCTTCNHFGHLRDSCQGNRPTIRRHKAVQKEQAPQPTAGELAEPTLKAQQQGSPTAGSNVQRQQGMSVPQPHASPAGDFNSVKSPEDKQLGVAPTWYELKDFVDCCLTLGLHDAPSTGCIYTWAKEADLALQEAQSLLESDPENAAIRGSLGILGGKRFFLPKLSDTFITKRKISIS